MFSVFSEISKFTSQIIIVVITFQIFITTLTKTFIIFGYQKSAQ